tara:strand:+ start:4053 stop:4871 length:819 start_codon:yes stop_codon:yes gene_type:complete
MNISLTESTKVNQFASIMKNLKNFSQDVEFVVSEDGVYTQGMDGSHCCLFEMILKSNWFDKFETDKRYVLGLNCELLAKVLNCLEQSQKIMMQYTEDRDDLFISLSPNDGESSIVKVFHLPLIDIESNLLEIPETEYSADIAMSSDDFGKLVNQLSIFGKDIRFELSDSIKVTGKGDDGTMSAIIKEDDIFMYAAEEDMELSLEYAGSFIVMMTAFSKLNKKIQIHFSEEMPMKIQYGLDNFMDEDEEEDDEEESKDKNFIRFFLAPKVHDD